MISGLVSVVIINFNSGKYIFKCLEAVLKQSYSDVEIIVVDNASSDGSKKILSEFDYRGEIRYVYLSENKGASGANNLGIAESNGEFILILNADVFLNKNYISKCVEVIQKGTEIGTVVGKLVSDGDSSVIDTVGIEIFKEGVSHEIGMGQKDEEQFSEEREIVGACCAAALYRKTMLESIKFEEEYYDEQFFAFVEDVDLSVRSYLFGWTTIYTPAAIGAHVRGGATSHMSDFVKYLNYRNSSYFLYKTFPDSLHSKALCLIRSFTISNKMKKKYKGDFTKDETQLKRKKAHIIANSKRHSLGRFTHRSYIQLNLLRRIKALIG